MSDKDLEKADIMYFDSCERFNDFWEQQMSNAIDQMIKEGKEEQAFKLLDELLQIDR